MKRYSKKRQAIIDCLKNTKEHPSAEWVYNRLKPEFPDLSLGTVYRNIKEFEDEGELCTVAVVAGKERFDARTDSHTHAVCAKCGKIIDVDEVKLPPELAEQVKKLTGFSVKSSNLQFTGLCSDCGKEEENGKCNE